MRFSASNLRSSVRRGALRFIFFTIDRPGEVESPFPATMEPDSGTRSAMPPDSGGVATVRFRRDGTNAANDMLWTR